MNQIYKVIWSRVKHCYVVVSEIAGRCGKNGGTASEKKSMPVRAFLCALAITGCLLPGMAGASFHGGIGATTATANSIAVGDDAKTTEEYTIALGSRSRAINIYAIAMGDQAQATGQGATAIGSLSKSTAEHSLAVGDQAEAAAVNSSAYGILSKALSSHSVAIGNGASVGKGDPDSVSSQNGIAIGNGANVTVNPATATPGLLIRAEGSQSGMMRQPKISIRLLSVPVLSAKARRQWRSAVMHVQLLITVWPSVTKLGHNLRTALRWGIMPAPVLMKIMCL